MQLPILLAKQYNLERNFPCARSHLSTKDLPRSRRNIGIQLCVACEMDAENIA